MLLVGPGSFSVGGDGGFKLREVSAKLFLCRSFGKGFLKSFCGLFGLFGNGGDFLFNPVVDLGGGGRGGAF